MKPHSLDSRPNSLSLFLLVQIFRFSGECEDPTFGQKLSRPLLTETGKAVPKEDRIAMEGGHYTLYRDLEHRVRTMNRFLEGKFWMITMTQQLQPLQTAF